MKMTIDEMKNHEWCVSWSGGKDSTATILKMIEYKIPIKKIVHVRMMYTDTIPATIPCINVFIDTCIEKFRTLGLDVEIIQSEPAINLVNKKYKKSKKPGRNSNPYGITAFSRKGCLATSHLKLKAIKKVTQQFDNRYEMVGIAVDEPKRLERLDDKKASILETLNITENECLEICKVHDCLSPIYNIGIKRDGCFFCPNAGKAEREYIKENCPELFEEIMKMYKMCNYDINGVLNNWLMEVK